MKIRQPYLLLISNIFPLLPQFYSSLMEGPSLVIFKEELEKFIGKTVVKAEGSSKVIDPSLFKGQKLASIKTWGKYIFLRFSKASLKVHFLMFGSYRVDAVREGRIPRLSLSFRNGEVNFYACSIGYADPTSDGSYDPRVDVMSPKWDRKTVLRKLNENPRELLCDVLLDQNIFAGVGNIIKNEVLHRLLLHPNQKVENLTPYQKGRLISEAREYAFQFYEWKKQYVLRKNWKIYRQKSCSRCQGKVLQKKTGKRERRSFYCPRCQRLKVSKN